MIIVSGYKVWPRDVEDVLYQHPAVLEACVVGRARRLPRRDRARLRRAAAGERRHPTTSSRIVARLLAVYKAPREVVIVDEIPKTLTGKALRRELRERARLETSTSPSARNA